MWRRSCGTFLICGRSLDGRRTANTQINHTEPGVRDHFFFLRQPDCGKHGLDVIETGSWRSAMSHHADGAGGAFSLIWMVVSGLCYRRP
jgi:hypothetical protein